MDNQRREELRGKIQQLRQAGVPDAMIQQRLQDMELVPATPPQASPVGDMMGMQEQPMGMQAQTMQQPEEDQGLLEGFLRSEALPIIGSIGGGILGATAGLPALGVGAIGGGIVGSAAGGAGGEMLRRGLLRIMGEDPDEGEDDAGTGLLNDVQASAWEGLESGAFSLVGGAAGKVVGKVGGKVIGKAGKIFNLTPKNLARRAIPLSPEEFAEINSKLRGNDVYNIIFKEGILDAKNADEMMSIISTKQQSSMQALDKVLAQKTAEGVKFKTADLIKSIDDDIGSKLKMPGTGDPIMGSQQALSMIDDFKASLKNYGDDITPLQAQEIKQKLYGVISTFKEGALSSPDIKRRFAGLFRKEIESVAPEAIGHNQTYMALEAAKDPIGRAAAPAFATGGLFGSALQALPIAAGVGGFAGGGPVGGGAAYLAATFGSQVLKDPATAGRLASLMYKIGRLGTDAPPIAKILYNLTQPVLVQSGGRAATGGNDDAEEGDVLGQLEANTKKGNAELTNDLLLRNPNDLGLDQVEGGEYFDPSLMRTPNGDVNTHGLGLTREAAAVAMLAYPKHKELIQDIYKMLNPDDEEMSPDDKKQLRKLNTVQGVSNVAKQYMSQIKTGPMSGTVANLKNAATMGNADINAANYNEWRGAMVSVLARSISQEVGTMTDQDIKRADGLLPKLTDSEEKVRFKLQQLDAIIQDGFDDMGVFNKKAPRYIMEEEE